MIDPRTLQFTEENYPKSHASIRGWRLQDFLHLSEEMQHQVYKELERFCLHRANHILPQTSYRDYFHLGSGWEWSVFAKDESMVAKIPAGVFDEVNTPEYLDNARHSYELIRKYYPNHMVAETEFFRQDDTNIIEQQRQKGQDNRLIDFDQADEWTLEQLHTFLECTARLMDQEKWLPDFWLDEDPKGFILRNVMIDQESEQFTIIDFTSYLDPSRMYPALCQKHINLHTSRVQTMLEHIKRLMSQ